jgi:membrane-associated phospholipid phosphatase
VGYAVLLLVFLPVLHGAGRRIAVGVAVLMVLGIGLSRVALGVHYVSDVLAGYVLGAAWATAMIASFKCTPKCTASTVRAPPAPRTVR